MVSRHVKEKKERKTKALAVLRIPKMRDRSKCPVPRQEYQRREAQNFADTEANPTDTR